MHPHPTLTAPITIGPGVIGPTVSDRTEDATARLAERIGRIIRVERSIVDVLISLGSQSRTRAVRRIVAVQVSETKEQLDRLTHMAILLRYGSDTALLSTGDADDVVPERAAPFVTTDLAVLDAAIGIALRQIDRAESIRADVVGYGGVRALVDDGLAQQRARLAELEAMRAVLAERSITTSD